MNNRKSRDIEKIDVEVDHETSKAPKDGGTIPTPKTYYTFFEIKVFIQG